MKKYKVTFEKNGRTKTFEADEGENLSFVLLRNGEYIKRPCGGNGRCGKCIVSVNGKNEKACSYAVTGDIYVKAPDENVCENKGLQFSEECDVQNASAALDIGSTTIEMALFSKTNGEIFSRVKSVNPQTAVGADVISRIAFCKENGLKILKEILTDKLNEMGSRLCKGKKVDTLYVSGNTVMLHFFLNVSPVGMGEYPYKPVFTASQSVEGKKIGIDFAENVITLPCISSFVGADIVAGISNVEPCECFDLLVDLGTNCEIALFNNDKVFCTSAAAGPCFEGVGISCGMTALPGAICSYDGSYRTIGDLPPEGICATGLIDIISYLSDRNLIKNSNLAVPSFEIEEEIAVTREDVQSFFFAKSAVFTGIKLLCSETGIDLAKIRHFFVAGGFSEMLNIKNAVKAGLFPAELTDKFVPMGNSSLSGTIAYAINGKKYDFEKSEYLDLAECTGFEEGFMGARR